MKVYDCEQRSEEWFELRKGVFTASDMGAWVLAEKRNKTQEKAAFSAICKKLAEMSGCEMEPVFQNWAMKWGTEHEDEARDFYTEETGNEVEEVGFCIHDNGGFGCSPDGFIHERKGMLEIKCPLPQTQVKRLLQGGFPDEHFIQCHMQMAVTGCKYVDFYSYCPSLPSFSARLDWDDTTYKMLAGLNRLSKELKEHQTHIFKLWDEMKNKTK